MLYAILDAAVNWMRAGLPLETLRIVIYSEEPKKISQKHKRLLALFRDFKKAVEKTPEKPTVGPG